MARVASARLRPPMLLVLATLLRSEAAHAQDLDDFQATPPLESRSPEQTVEDSPLEVPSPDEQASSSPEQDPPGEADDNRCLSNHREGQKLERSGQLLGATLAYRQCLRPHCSPVLREDCGARLTMVESSTPTVILAAQHRGKDLADVDVYDGDVLLQKGFNGVAVPLDPGPHRLKFVAPGFAPLPHSIVARVGEKNRVVVVVLGPDEDDRAPSSPGPVAAHSSPLSPDLSAETTPPSVWGAWEYGLFSAGAALGVGGVAFGVLAFADYRAAQSECAPACSDDRMSRIRTKAYTADALLALSVAAVVTGSVRVVLAKKRSRRETALVLAPGFITAETRF